MITTEDWKKYFPYENPRIQQENTINSVLNEFKNGKKYAIIDCGTGVGKSAIGVTISNYINNSSDFNCTFNKGTYLLTTQKILQDQYEKDFKKSQGLVSLYSSSNYICKSDGKASCKDIQTGLRSNSLPKKYSNCSYNCCYKIAKKEFIEKNLGITNFSYFLTEKNYSQKIPHKQVLIIDEAHNLENELTRFIEISISSYFSEKILKLKVPDDLNTQFKIFSWIKNVYYLELVKKTKFIKEQLEKFGITSTKLEEFKKITNRYDMLTGHEKKILQFINLYDKDNWIFDIEKSDKSYFKFIFKPIEINMYVKDYLLNFADYVVFMSATILSHEGYSLTLGLQPDQTISIKEDSPFDSQNKPILFFPAGSMSYNQIDKTLPKQVEMINSILDHHKNEKGIIHTHSIKIANYIKNNISRKNRKRLLLAFGENRDQILKDHIESKENTVLLSPSMSEGVDLKGQLSSFQVICKIPFPFLGDKVVKKKMNKWSWWYDVQTIRTIVQSVGRSIRSENDKAVTYILDSDWSRIFSKNKKLFPKSFLESYKE